MENNETHVDYVLIQKSKPVSFILASRHKKSKPLLFRSEEGTKAMRYCPNETSIFVEDQSHYAMTEPIEFRDGRLRVPSHNKQLIEFLAKHPENNKTYRIHDIKKEKQAIIDLDRLRDEAIIANRGLSIEAKKAIVVKLSDSPVHGLTPEDIHIKARSLSQQKPKEFMALVNSSDMSISEAINYAIDEKFLNVRQSGVFFNLEDNKKRAFAYDPDEDNLEAATAEWFKTEAGQEFYAFIKKEMKSR